MVSDPDCGNGENSRIGGNCGDGGVCGNCGVGGNYRVGGAGGIGGNICTVRRGQRDGSKHKTRPSGRKVGFSVSAVNVAFFIPARERRVSIMPFSV